MSETSKPTISPEYAALRRAVMSYFRAKDDKSWSAYGGPGGRPVNWHKRHDLNKAEAKLREMIE